MKRTTIYIDVNNKEQVEWWDNKARWLVGIVRYDTIVETATNKIVGIIFTIEGVLTNHVVKKNNEFLNNPKH